MKKYGANEISILR